MTDPTIAAGFAKALMDLAISKGASKQALIERSHIRDDALLNQDNRIPLAKFIALMKAGVELCDEPALALQFGEAFTMPELSIVGLICESAKTMADAHMQMNRYARLMFNADDGKASDWLELVRNDDEIWLELTSSIYNNHPRLAESAFARAICGFARDFGDMPFAKAIHFTHEEPSYRAEYDRVFKVPIVFGSDKNAVLIHESFLSLKLAPTNRYVFGVLSERADMLLKDLESSKTVKGQVESLLVPVLHTGELSMGRIAEMLGLSRQALYRRLKKEGVSYEKLLDELRHKMALHYLSGKKVSVNETAYLVGFSHPSAFSRAFKRWTGRSPGKTRAAKTEL